MLQFVVGYDTHSKLYTVEDTTTGHVEFFADSSAAMDFISKAKEEGEQDAGSN